MSDTWEVKRVKIERLNRTPGRFGNESSEPFRQVTFDVVCNGFVVETGFLDFYEEQWGEEYIYDTVRQYAIEVRKRLSLQLGFSF